MYDKLLLKLEAAQVMEISFAPCFILTDGQFIVGNNLQSCLDALVSGSSDSLHLLERIDIHLQVQNSIVPTALNLARFKVSGKLPTLQVNLSDTKYKSLMRLVDVCIPKFEGDVEKESPPTNTRSISGAFQLSSGLFSQPEIEYNIVDDDDDDPDDDDDDEGSASRDDLFFEAEDGTSEVCAVSDEICCI